MGKLQRLECDNCHTTEDVNNVDGWLAVQTVVGNVEALERRMEDGVVADYGDFCTLRCLGEWAFAQELLRDLSEEVTDE